MHRQMNTYYITFYFNEEWHYITITSNQIANKVLDDVLGQVDSIEGVDKQALCEHIHSKGQKYVVDFSYNSASLLNIYVCEQSEDGFEDETLIQPDVPYTVIKIVNNGKKIYDLGDCL